MIEIGSLDRLTSVIGLRGMGKSTWLVHDALAAQSELGAIVLGHSPGARLPAKLPDGRASNIVYHSDLRSLERGIRRRGGTSKLHVMAAGEVDDLIAYARQMARAIRRSAVTRAGHRFRDDRPVPDGILATPVHVMVDEGSALRDWPKKSVEQRGWEVFITGLRHEHLSLTWSIQSPAMRSWKLLEQSNRVIAFRYLHRWGLDALQATGMIPQEDLPLIRALPQFEHRVYGYGGKGNRGKG